MGPPKPKQFVAARPFRYRRHAYKVGDPITDPATIARLVRYGERFAAVARTPKTAPAETPQPTSADPIPAESPKED